MDDDHQHEDACRIDAEKIAGFRAMIPGKAEKIIESCNDKECYTHIDYELIPSKGSVIEIIERSREILFPGYFSREKLDPITMKYSMGKSVSDLFNVMADQVTHSIRHDCKRYNQPCSECTNRGHEIAIDFLEKIPDLRKRMALDVRAVYEGDPAAKSYDEIIFSYPGIFATLVYRVAHTLHELQVPLIPRIMTEYAHGSTGIDIHPGAEIGDSFVMDHGTGIVIGETAVVGNNVRIYQGVTLGALSLPKGSGDRLKGKKRHPTIENDVIIYSGATILGGDTVIGARSVIGGNVWLTQSIPPDTKVMLEAPRLIYK